MSFFQLFPMKWRTNYISYFYSLLGYHIIHKKIIYLKGKWVSINHLCNLNVFFCMLVNKYNFIFKQNRFLELGIKYILYV